MRDDFQIPQATESERAVLGAIILNGDCVLQAIDTIEPDDFFLESHRRIYRQMLALADADVFIDPITVAGALEDAGELALVGGREYLSTLYDQITLLGDLSHYLDAIKRKSQARRLLRAAQAIESMCLDPEGEDLLGESQRVFYEASEAKLRSPFVHISDAGREYLEELEQIEAGTKGAGFHTGLAAVDVPLAGLQAGELCVIAGRPSNGKTTLTIDIARRLGLDGRKIAYFSLEMGRRKIAEKTVGAEGRFNPFEFRKEMFSVDSTLWNQEHWKIAYEAVRRLEKCQVWLCDESSLGPLAIRAKCQRFRRDNSGLDAVIIDYLGLMEFGASPYSKRHELVGEACRKMKMLARELDCAVLLVHQLNREVEKQNNPQPKLSHLADSGDIEKHADVIMFLYRLIKGERDETFIDVAKNRNGPTAKMQVKYIREENRFENWHAGT